MSGPHLPLNGLTVAYMALPAIAGTFFKHRATPKDSHSSKRPEVHPDEALVLARSLMQKFTQYPVEDVQRLANSFQPAPRHVRVIRVSIPASTCLSAADYLITAFGPVELQRVVGGRQWWQLRSNKDGSVEGEWIAMKRDLPRSPLALSATSSPSKSSSTVENHSPLPKSPRRSNSKQRRFFESLRRRRSKSASRPSCSTSTSEPAVLRTASPESDPEVTHEPAPTPHLHTHDPASTPEVNLNTDQISNSSEQPNPGDPYEDDLDQMPCMLYIHGGAYYLCSINTHRYSIWRYARKMGGRAFAVNYRLAPQYPFPCALADCLAAYLYLIRPPTDAKHRAIDPSKIVIAGDSAGGGLSLALLTLIRDAGLPMPAGAVLISPWVDLTHSFPSIMSNADKDIIPPYGFIHQPSVLWPPPPLPTHSNITKAPQSESLSQTPSETLPQPQSSPDLIPEAQNPYKLKVSPELKIRSVDSDGTKPVVEFDDGEEVVINQQIQLYATNDQLTHPYCSPLFSPSLGGLSPLFIVAGQNEALRDEIIYMAHRAAHPDRYPLREDLMNANPERKVKAGQYAPTQVHLQVYDEMFHVLPLFSFLQPAKYCYRAIGSFCKYVTGAVKTTSIDSAVGPSESFIKPIENANLDSAEVVQSNTLHTPHGLQIPTIHAESSDAECSPHQLPTLPSSPQDDLPSQPSQPCRLSIAVPPRIKSGASTEPLLSPDTLTELKETIYHASLPHRRPDFKYGMIRERVATDGKIRPLEDETELEILRIPPGELGAVKEGPLKRWAEGRKIWDEKFARQYKKIQLEREHQVRRSNKRAKQSLKKISKSRPSKRKSVYSTHGPKPNPEDSSGMVETNATAERLHDVDGILSIPFGWRLPEDERPPPSSLAARHDNTESLKLAKGIQRQRMSKIFNGPSCIAA